MRKVYIYLFSMILMLLVIGYTGREKTELEPEAEPEVSAAGESNVTAEFEAGIASVGSVAEAAGYVDFEILVPDLLRQEYAQERFGSLIQMSWRFIFTEQIIRLFIEPG